ncbi:MAG: hypothetical protein V4673_14565 [Pseudomonadota bacterium]
MRVEYRPTVAEDLAVAVDQVLPHRIQATTVVIDGRVMGFGGIGFLPDGTVVAFVFSVPEAKNFPVAFHRAGLKTMDMIRRMGLHRVVAEATKDNPAAERWLVRLGFEPLTVLGRTVFVWTRR